MRGDAPTIHDIARHAGVSLSTVSKALSATIGRYRVAPATRDRILAIARDLGFGGATRAGRRKGRIALLFGGEGPNIGGINADLHLALLTATLSHHLDVIFQPMDDGSDEVRARNVARVDGCLLLEPMPRSAAAWESWLRQIRHFPPVVAVNPGRTLPIPSVAPDDSGGAGDLMADLFSRGHRRLGVVGHLRSGPQHGSQALRHRALLQTGREIGAVVDDWTDLTGTVVATAWKALGAQAPSAVVALSSWNIVELLLSLALAGLTVPRDLAVATCDDPPLNQQLTPPVTGLIWSMEGMVATALHKLNAVIDGGSAGGCSMIPERIVHRASTIGWRPRENEEKT